MIEKPSRLIFRDGFFAFISIRLLYNSFTFHFHQILASPVEKALARSSTQFWSTSSFLSDSSMLTKPMSLSFILLKTVPIIGTAFFATTSHGTVVPNKSSTISKASPPSDFFRSCNDLPALPKINPHLDSVVIWQLPLNHEQTIGFATSFRLKTDKVVNTGF